MFLLFFRLAVLSSLIAGESTRVGTRRRYPEATQVFATTPSRSSLACEIELDKKSRLNFTFRYTAVVMVECRLSVLAPVQVERKEGV